MTSHVSFIYDTDAHGLRIINLSCNIMHFVLMLYKYSIGTSIQ